MMRFAQSMIGGILTQSVVPTTDCGAEEVAIFKIVEDWEMVLNEPDLAHHSPQGTFFTTPMNDSNRCFQLQFNHALDTDFWGGGFRVAAVENGEILGGVSSETRAASDTDASLGRSQYHPPKSLDAVDVGFGANRVAFITLPEVRVFYAGGATVPVFANRQL